VVPRIVGLLLVLCAVVPASAAGQASGGKIQVSYDVVFSASLTDPTCGGTGTDVLAGTLVGFEPAALHDDNEYVGTLTRTTRAVTCGVKRKANGEDDNCNFDIAGNGFADVVFKVNGDQRGGWLQYITNRQTWAKLLPPPAVGPQNSTVTGTCDPAEMSQMQTDYPNGQTAASPNGQPIEVTGLPPSTRPTPSAPVTYPAKPPTSIWTLKILARRP
jgi:hypothetical protein